MFTTTNKWGTELDNIKNLLVNGHSVSSIATKYKVTKQRISQVLKKYKISLPTKTTVQDLKAAEHFKKWGNKTKSIEYLLQRKKFRDKKRNAIERGIEFTLVFGNLTWPEYCPALGIKINYSTTGRLDNNITFDRINPTKGYTPENTRLISWRANRIKNDATSDELYKIFKYVASQETPS